MCQSGSADKLGLFDEARRFCHQSLALGTHAGGDACGG